MIQAKNSLNGGRVVNLQAEDDGSGDGQLLVRTSASATAEATLTPVQFTKAVASASVPEKLTAVSTKFHKAFIKAIKASRVANTGNVFIGVVSTNDTQPQELLPGDEVILEAPPGFTLDFANFYLDVATANDAVTIYYW